MKKKFSFLEGTRWKELARQGKLNQFDFNRLQQNDVGKKYLNPRNIIKNAEKGRWNQMKKMGLNPLELDSGHVSKSCGGLMPPVARRSLIKQYKNHGFDTSSITPDKNAIYSIHRGIDSKDNSWDEFTSTALQRGMTRVHELDEIIGSRKLFTNKKFRNALAKKIRNIKKSNPGMTTSQAYQQAGIESVLSLYDGAKAAHAPGVMRKEVELRNLLYPSYSGKNKRSFSNGKFTVLNLDDSMIGELNDPDAGINDTGVIRTKPELKVASMSDKQAINRIIDSLSDRDTDL